MTYDFVSWDLQSFSSLNLKLLHPAINIIYHLYDIFQGIFQWISWSYNLIWFIWYISGYISMGFLILQLCSTVNCVVVFVVCKGERERERRKGKEDE